MWLPQGGALKIENLQFTQYSIIMLNATSYTQHHNSKSYNTVMSNMDISPWGH